MKAKALIILMIIVYINIIPISAHGSIINVSILNDEINTYTVSNQNEKIQVLNYIKANLETNVRIIYSGDTIPLCKKDLKFYYFTDTFDYNYIYQNDILINTYQVNSNKGFGIKDISYNKKDKTVSVVYEFSYYDDFEHSKFVIDRINSEIKNNISFLQNDYQKALWAYNWVINNVHYDYNLNNFSAYSGVNGDGTVCIGYSVLYSLIMNKLGLECKFIEGSVYKNTGNNHAWNIIKLDGKWYCVDTTWGDQVGLEKYFLKSIYTMNTSEYGYHVSEVYDNYIKAGEVFSDDDYSLDKIVENSPMSPSVYNVNMSILKVNYLGLNENFQFVIDNPDNIKLEYTSTDSKVVKIDKNGLITGNKVGETIVTAYNVDLNIAQSCKITVIK